MNKMNRTYYRLYGLTLTVVLAVVSMACAPPTAKIRVTRNEIKAGEPVTVSWETKNAKTIELNGEKVEKIGAKTFTPDDDANYEVIARRGKKEARDSASVKVDSSKAAAPSITLRADPSGIERGQNTMLRWTTQNTKFVTLTGIGRELPPEGETEVSPRVSTTYTATALGDGGNATASIRVTVTDPAGPPMAERPRTTQPSEAEAAIADQFRSVLSPVFFDYNESAIRGDQQGKLRRIADWLNLERNRSIVFRIEGNCDPRGTSEYNLGLGDRRALSIKDYLVSLGVDPGRIETVSYGAEKAQGSDEGSPEAPPSWAHDRRGDFVYLRGGDRP